MNQMFRYITSVEAHNVGRTNTVERNEDVSGSVELNNTFEEMIGIVELGDIDWVGPQNSSAGSLEDDQAQGHIDLKIEDKEALTMVSTGRRTHIEWDKRKREMQALLISSSKSLYTKDTRLEQDVRNCISEGDEFDAHIQKIEQAYMCDKSLTLGDKQTIKGNVESLFNVMKNIAPKAISLKTLMKLDQPQK